MQSFKYSNNFFPKKSLLAGFAAYIFALSAIAAPGDIKLYLPRLDTPFQSESALIAPSMPQSLYLSKSFYQAAHHYLRKSFDNQTNFVIVSLGFDIVSAWLPLGDSWLHEEWHRAVMAQYRIDSYNEVYKLNFFSESISVSHVLDEQLTKLKLNHPQDIIRLHAAGMEAQTELNFLLEQDLFFNDIQSWDIPLLWLNYANTSAYLSLCASKEADVETQQFLKTEGNDVRIRDFTGLDCNAWVYDLFRPLEPYGARGIHPSGSGIDRYIQFSDLTRNEKKYLKSQALYSLLNFFNPQLFGKVNFSRTNKVSGRPQLWNASLHHYLTSFGYAIDVNFFYRESSTHLLAIYHNYFNHSHYFPGIEIRWLDRPLLVSTTQISWSPRIHFWRQPRDGNFNTEKSRIGGLIALQVLLPIAENWQTYIEIESKTAGWVAGNIDLDNQNALRIGLTYTLRK